MARGAGERHGPVSVTSRAVSGWVPGVPLCGQRDAFAGFPTAELSCFSGAHLFLAAPPSRQSVVITSCGVASLGPWPSSLSVVSGSSLASSWPLPIPAESLQMSF